MGEILTLQEEEEDYGDYGDYGEEYQYSDYDYEYEEEEEEEEEEELLGPALEIKEQCDDENLFSLRPKS